MGLCYVYGKTFMNAFDAVDRQEAIEAKYSRKHIDKRIKDEIICNPDMQAKLLQGVQLLEEWLNGQYYDSKMARLYQVAQMDLHDLVMKLFVGIAYYRRPELYTSVTSQLAGRLGLSDKLEAITTVAEMVAVLCMTDAFDIGKESKYASLKLMSCIPLSEDLLHYIEHSDYLPPMVCMPNELRSNRDSGYLSHKDSLILGSGNHHEGDICLDVLNKMNRVKLKLDTQFLSTIEEEPSELTIECMKENALKKGLIISDQEAADRLQLAKENWSEFKRKSYHFYSLINNHGNEFYLTHKYDKRGRAYAQGYHISTMGSSFKKASIELATEEVVEGVPQA